MRKPDAPWSWVDEAESRRPQAKGRGRYSRPPSIQEMVMAGAIGRTLARLRKERNFSQRELAGIVGVSQAFIAQLEGTRIKGVMLHQVFDFATALKVEPAVFVAACQEACARFQRGLERRSPQESTE